MAAKQKTRNAAVDIANEASAFWYQREPLRFSTTTYSIS
jgi:hypothetical protein